MSDYISREAMSETPKCPGCGADMELMHLLCNATFYYVCPKCGWDSPVGIDPESAFRMAMHRVEPKNRVLTLEELKNHAGFLWNENRFESEGEPAYAENDFLYVGNGNVDLKLNISKIYGRRWRCWLRKPTEEETEGTPWEGDDRE